MNNTLMIFDVNAILWRYMFKHDGKFYGKHFTGGLYGFLQAFSSNINMWKPDRVILTDDCPPYDRKKDFPEYKGNRKKDKKIFEFAQESKGYIEDFLQALGVPVWTEPGLEADDLIYLLCEEYHKRYDTILLTCTDDDLYQCFKWKNVYMIKKRKNLYGRRMYFREHRMTPEQWIRYSVVKGTHNNIKGVVGIGKKKARNYTSDLAYDNICQEHPELRKYEQLIRLPYRYVDIPDLKTKGVDRLLLRRLLQEFGIRLSVNEYFQAAFDYLDTI